MTQQGLEKVANALKDSSDFCKQQSHLFKLKGSRGYMATIAYLDTELIPAIEDSYKLVSKEYLKQKSK